MSDERKLHTPEPWDTGPLTGAGHVWIYARGGVIAEPLRSLRDLFQVRSDDAGWGPKGKHWERREADASRTVACVNAMAGVEDPARFVEATRDLMMRAHAVVSAFTGSAYGPNAEKTAHMVRKLDASEFRLRAMLPEVKP